MYTLFELAVRCFAENDISLVCPYMPEDHEFQIYFESLIQDIEKLELVLSVTIDGASIIIQTSSQLTERELKGCIRPFVIGVACFVKFVHLKGLQ